MGEWTKRYTECDSKFIEQPNTMEDFLHNLDILKQKIPLMNERNKVLNERIGMLNIFLGELFKDSPYMKEYALKEVFPKKLGIDIRVFKEGVTNAAKFGKCDLEFLNIQTNYYLAIINNERDSIIDKYSKEWDLKLEECDKLTEDYIKMWMKLFRANYDDMGKELMEEYKQVLDPSFYEAMKEIERKALENE